MNYMERRLAACKVLGSDSYPGGEWFLSNALRWLKTHCVAFKIMYSGDWTVTSVCGMHTAATLEDALTDSILEVQEDK
jgi:hypothetical protein